MKYHTTLLKKDELNWKIILYHRFYKRDHFDKMKEVFENKFRNHDLVIISYGVHEARVLSGRPEHYKDFLAPLLEYWNTQQENTPPVVWLPQNPECAEILNPTYSDQVEIMEKANEVARDLFSHMPFLDMDQLLKFQLCSLSGDGLHIKAWVEIIRAKILLNEICDENWNFKIPDYMISPHILNKKRTSI